MVCLGFKPGAAGWNARTNPLSYGGTPSLFIVTSSPNSAKTGRKKWSDYWLWPVSNRGPLTEMHPFFQHCHYSIIISICSINRVIHFIKRVIHCFKRVIHCFKRVILNFNRPIYSIKKPSTLSKEPSTLSMEPSSISTDLFTISIEPSSISTDPVCSISTDPFTLYQ